MRRSLGLTLALAAVLLTGCFEVEQSIHLEKDRSGTASFAMTVNFEGMAVAMAQMQHSMSGKPGEPTAAEIEEAKKEFAASRKEEKKSEDFAAKKADWEKTLPPGVKLLDGGVDDQGMKVFIHFRFSFDDVAKLAQIQFPNDKAGDANGGGMPGSKNPFQDLFGGLRVVDEGKTLLLTSTAVNPLKNEGKETKPAAEGAPDDPMAKQAEQLLKTFKLTFKIDSPFEVASTNATRRDGKTLYWEYTLDTFKDKAKQQQAEQGIRVRFKK